MRRSKLLPEGGNIHSLSLQPLQQRLRDAAQWSQLAGEIIRSEAGRELWGAVYPALSGDRYGPFGSVTSRAEAQILRLALVYALLDCSPYIEVRHLQAALAVWKYCEASARMIFGGSTGDRTADELLKALRSTNSGLTKTDMSNLFKRNKSAAELDRAIGVLSRDGLIRPEIESAEIGRPTERWFAVERPAK